MPKLNQKGLPHEAGIAHILVVLLLLLAIPVGVYLAQHPTVFKPKAQEFPQTGVLEWLNQSYSIAIPVKQGDSVKTFSVPMAGNTKLLGEDVLITNIKIDITGFPTGSIFDNCNYVFRNTLDPKYEGLTGGYSEYLCWTFKRDRDSQPDNWHVNVDLSQTPLFLPKNTDTACGTNVAIPVSATSENIRYNCTLTYKKYIPGEKRFRSFRLPYIDQANIYASEGSIGYSPTAYYIGSEDYPLHIKAAYLYPQPISWYNPNSTNKACLKWLHQGGVVVDEKCFADQAMSPSNVYYQPQKLDFDWKIPSPDLLSNNCYTSVYNVDCVMWAITEISDQIEPNAENIFRDYGNIPRGYFEKYCRDNVKTDPKSIFGYDHAFFCSGQTNCTTDTKIQTCINKLFPEASCLATNSCKKLSAQYSSTPPSSVAIGKTLNYQVTLTNTGSQTWNSTGTNQVNLIAYIAPPGGNWDNALAKKTFILTSDVPSRSSQTVNVSIPVPQTSGDFVLYHQMVKQGVTFFSEVQQLPITINQGTVLSSSFSGNVPIGWNAGTAQNYSITITNTGSDTWLSSGTNMTNLLIYFGDSYCGCGSDKLIVLPNDVAPDSQITLNLNVTAPTIGGNYMLKHQMIKQGIAFFQDKLQTPVRVRSIPALSVLYKSTPSTTWEAGQSKTYQLEVQNDGYDTWTGTGANQVDLGVYFTSTPDPDGWFSAAEKVMYPVPATVAPGELATFNITIKSPTQPGIYHLYHRMIKQGISWFKEYSVTDVEVN